MSRSITVSIRWCQFLSLLCIGSRAAAEDWPMWRHDAGRGAATAQELPADLHPQWVLELPALKTAWPDQAKMVFDRNYEPVVAGNQLFVPSSLTDSVTAYSTRTGERNWVFHAEGPVRFAPIAHGGKVYFVSDDSCLYCLDAKTGKQIWKFLGGPPTRKIVGNGRLISAWPARGGPVLADSTIYFAASIWPFMGIFIHAVDAETGNSVWTNDGDGTNYIIQPHGAYSFAGVTPQGALCVSGDKLLVPSGRSVPACLDRKTGKQLYYHHGRRSGGSDVFAVGRLFINNGAACDLENGDSCGSLRGPIAFDRESLYLAGGGSIRKTDIPRIKTKETKDNRGRKRTERTLEFPPDEFKIDAPSLTEMIRAGSRFYGAEKRRLYAIDAPSGGDPAKEETSWQTEVDGHVVRLLAADDRLFAVTLEGRIHCFGGERIESRRHAPATQPIQSSNKQRALAKSILKSTGATSGYCVVWGIGDGGLAAELIAQSDLFVVAVEPDRTKIAAARKRFVDAGLYGRRCSIHRGTPQTAGLPPYLARLTIAAPGDADWLTADEVTVEKLYAVLRPYGGKAVFYLESHGKLVKLLRKSQPPQAELDADVSQLVVTRVGAPPGSANWTHEHADAANTRASRDTRVKAPLGVLWFGGPSHEPILPRHGHGPQPQVINGQLIIEGPDLLRCVDIYTGLVLWERALPGVGKLYNNTGHHPGANGTGANYNSVSDGVYVLYGRKCLRLDLETGKTLIEYVLPKDNGTAPELCYINAADDVLILGCDLDTDADSEKRQYEDYISCQRIAVLDRKTGKPLWSIDAEFQFRNNAICVGGGRLYCVDLLSEFEIRRLERRGRKPTGSSRLYALDLQTGKPIWKTDDEVMGTWLSYSDKHDLLFETGRPGRDVLRGEPGGMRGLRAADGKQIWKTGENGPAMVLPNRILNATGRGFDLLTGKPLQRLDPISGKSTTWDWKRNYGCNTPQCSRNLLLFRSGAAGYYDLARDGGTGNLGGFRSSCTNNLIVAGGVLSAPDYTRTCGCAYQNQTSLGLIHMPEVEMWTFTPFGFDDNDPIQRLAINFGAPGDRRTDDGTLWIDHPSVGGSSPKVPVKVTGENLRYFRHHASRISAASEQQLPWICSSGVVGLRELRVPLGGDDKTERSFRVTLHFAEVAGKRPGERVFDVRIDDGPTLENIDPARLARGTNRAAVRQVRVTLTASEMKLTFSPRKGEPLLCGVEVVAEK